MQPNLYDSVLEQTLARIQKATDRIGQDFKNVKPFDKEPISKDELLYYFKDLSLEDMNYLVQTHGREAMNEFISEMEEYKRRRENA